MRFAVMGAGAIGGYLGGRLAAAGHEVALIARGTHLAAIREDGLTIQSPKGDLHLPDITATDDPNDIEAVDCIIFLVKNYDVEVSARQMMPMVGPDTTILTFQNGVTASDIVRTITGSEKVWPGVIRFPADIRAPGVVRHSAQFDPVIFGEPSGGASPGCTAVAAALESADLMVSVAGDIMQEIWEKMTMQASFASITSLTRLDIGPIRDNGACAAMFRASMAETEAVAMQVLPGLNAGMAERQWAFLRGIPPDVHSSMLDDLQRGKRIEIDSLSGAVATLGRAHKVATPLHDMFTAALQPFVDGALG